MYGNPLLLFLQVVIHVFWYGLYGSDPMQPNVAYVQIVHINGNCLTSKTILLEFSSKTKTSVRSMTRGVKSVVT